MAGPRRKSDPVSVLSYPVYERVTLPGRDLSSLFSSDTDQWLTPLEFLKVLEGLAPIVLDPCGNPLSVVRAQRQILLPECGLAASWPLSGLVFINPPFGSALAEWSERMRAHAAAGGELVALVPARTDTGWWRVLDPALWCAWAGRLRFLQALEDWQKGEIKRAAAAASKGKPRKVRAAPPEVAPGLVAGDAAPFPVAVCYHGPRPAEFARAFWSSGPIYQRLR